MSRPAIKYRVRSIQVPDWYVAQRSGSFGRMAGIAEAMQETKEFWLNNLNPNWRSYFVMEPVDG
jgi:hypothetical protein